MTNLLLITLFLPLAGFIISLFLCREKVNIIKYFALGVSILPLISSALLYFHFDPNGLGFQGKFDLTWVSSLDMGFRIGVDGISLLLVLLTNLLAPIAILSSFNAIEKRVKEYYAMLLLLQFAMIGVFVATDLFLFYVFWEMILIPMYFIIGIWGGKDRLYAAVKFFLFTIIGSLFMLAAIIWIGVESGRIISALDPATVGSFINGEQLSRIKDAHFTSNFVLIKEVAPQFAFEAQKWLFLAFALSFCIKVPLFPLHTWLPDAHVQAPTAGSVILAGVLLKMGTYGLVRFNLELFPEISKYYSHPIAWLAVIGIIYGALTALVQTDIKKLVAYSSVSHLGFVVLGIFSMTEEGLQGAIIQMVNHGLSTGMLFLCVGMLYERRHTREISEFGGITKVMPKFAVIFGIAMFASAGLPGLNGFVGEYLTLLGAFRSPVYNSWAFAAFSSTGVIFAAAYLLWMFQRVMFGQIHNPANLGLKDINAREYATVLPLILFIVWIGVYPSTFMKLTEKYSKATVEHVLVKEIRK